MFHRVGINDDQVFTRDLMVRPAFLEASLKYFISRDIDVVSLDECYRRLTSGKRVKRFVTFTLDDGYEDNLTQALPVFEKYGAPFSVFLTTGFPDHQIVLWWYHLENLIMNHDSIEFEDGNRGFSFRTSTKSEKKDAFWEIRRYIMQSKQEELLPRLQKIFKKDLQGLLDLTKKMALSWDQITELSNHPLATIGSHTVKHMALSELPEKEVLTEIKEAIGIIREKTGKPVAHLAYPYGISSTVGPREFRIAGQCDVKLAFTTESSNILKRHIKHLHALPRIEMTESWDHPSFEFYMNGFTPFIHKFIR